MAKNEAKVSEVLAASSEILGQNGGKMIYQAWRDALTTKIGAHENSLKHIVKNKLVLFWLEGFDAEMKPQLWIVNDTSLLTATKPIVELKIGEK